MLRHYGLNYTVRGFVSDPARIWNQNPIFEIVFNEFQQPVQSFGAAGGGIGLCCV